MAVKICEFETKWIEWWRNWYTALLCGGFIECFFLTSVVKTSSTPALDKADVTKKGIFFCLAKFRATSQFTVHDERSALFPTNITGTSRESWILAIRLMYCGMTSNDFMSSKANTHMKPCPIIVCWLPNTWGSSPLVSRMSNRKVWPSGYGTSLLL